MKKSFSTSLLFVVFLLCSYSYAAKTLAANSYENKATAIRVTFPEDWRVYNTEQNAPDQFKTFFKKDNTGKESLLFIASHPNQQAYARLTSETYEGSVSEYFELLYAVQKEKVRVLNARYDAVGDIIQWTFIAKTGQIELTFVETVMKRGDCIIRLGFWTFSPIFEKYKSLFDSITEKTAFLKRRGSSEVWETALGDLNERLDGGDLDFVQTIKQEKPASAPAICKGEKKSVLWAVKGRKNTVYLFGSIHVGQPSFYPLQENVESSFKSSKHLVVEMDVTSKEFQQKAPQILSKAKFEKGKSLKTVLSPGVYRNLATELEKIGLPTNTFDKLKPWVVAATLESLKMQAMGYMADYGVDRYFLERAKPDKQIINLESIEEQFKLLNMLNAEKFLAFTLLSLNSAELKTEKLIHAWRCGDLQAMEDILFESSPGFFDSSEEMYEKLFFSRNRKMVEKIKAYLTGEDDFFVVLGSGHLIGEKGIVALLKKAGYQVNEI